MGFLGNPDANRYSGLPKTYQQTGEVGDMNRRRVLEAVGVSLPLAVAGCLDQTDEEPPESDDGGDVEEPVEDDPDDDRPEDEGPERVEDVPSDAEAVAEATIDAAATGSPEEAASYAPDEQAEGGWDERYEDWWQPDDLHDVTFELAVENVVLARDAVADGVEMGEQLLLEYTLDLETEGDRYEHRTAVPVVELDGEWYAWLEDDLAPPLDATVGVERQGPDAVELTLADRDGPATVVVEGDDVDPAAYRLESVGDSLSLTGDDAGYGTYEVVATAEGIDDETTVETVELADPSDWEGVSEIELEGATANWVGLEPAPIEDAENPVLVLEEGEEYTITITSGDGAIHNLQLRDEDDEPVDGLETEFVESDEQTETLTFTATDALVTYVCEPHEATMRGDVTVVESSDDE